MTPKLKPPGTKRLKLTVDVLLSNFAFNVNWSRYAGAAHCGAGRGRGPPEGKAVQVASIKTRVESAYGVSA